MSRWLRPTLVVLCLTTPALADEMLVFKKDSPFKGAALRVASYQKKSGRLVIQGTKGELLSAAESAVDWPMSEKATAQLRETEDQEAAQRAEAARERKTAEAVSAQRGKKPLSVVEASRRYGVDKPAYTTASGSAQREVVVPGSRDAEARAEGAAGGGSASDPAEVKAARDRLAAAKAERDRVAKEIDELRNDRNTDPLSSAQRETRLKEKTKQLADLDSRVKSAEDALAKAQSDAAKARAAEKPAATPTPAR